jgi:hypothetical protein
LRWCCCVLRRCGCVLRRCCCVLRRCCCVLRRCSCVLRRCCCVLRRVHIRHPLLKRTRLSSVGSHGAGASAPVAHAPAVPLRWVRGCVCSRRCSLGTCDGRGHNEGQNRHPEENELVSARSRVRVRARERACVNVCVRVYVHACVRVHVACPAGRAGHALRADSGLGVAHRKDHAAHRQQQQRRREPLHQDAALTSAPGLASPCHICTGTGLTPPHICTGTGPTPHTSAHICTGSGLTPGRLCAGAY